MMMMEESVKLLSLSLGLLVLRSVALISSTDGVSLYEDPNQSTEVRVNDLLSKMTLMEKIGQMMELDRENLTAEVVKNYKVGSLLSGGGSAPILNGSAKTWTDMTDAYQKAALSTRLKIPYIYGIDAVHGHNNVYKATIFPHNIGLGVTRDPQLVKRVGAATALECRATGVPYAFSPCIAVCRDPRWGRCYESFSEDHTIVQQMTEIILGLQGDIPPGKPTDYPYVGGKDKVVACAKHYVGDGGTVSGINENNTIIDWEGLLKIHMPAYIDSIKKGVSSVMISFSSWNGKSMHNNYDLITKYLKGTLGFKGFVISDWQGIDKLTDPSHSNYTYSVETSINAGLDMIMVPYDYVEFTKTLKDLVVRNFVPMSRIDDAVRRILRVKFIAGLFENPFADLTLADALGSKEHRELAREAVRKSLVLLKNGKHENKPMLPLPKKVGKILVAGSHANDLGYQCGGWTITWHGASGNNWTIGTTILDGIKATIDSSTQIDYKINPISKYVKSSKYDYAIVVIGEYPYSETQGDSKNLTIPAQGIKTMKNVCKKVKCVVVLISGRPVVIKPYLRYIDALVAAWLPGSEGNGVSDVLFGDYGFTGKLARTWFKRVDQLPMNVWDSHYDPLFPFGFGLETKPVNLSADPTST